MFNFDYITKEDIEEHNPHWPEIPDHSYRILIVGDSGSGEANALVNLINHGTDIDEVYFVLKIHMKQNINCWLQKWKHRFKVFKWLKKFYWIIK